MYGGGGEPIGPKMQKKDFQIMSEISIVKDQ